MLIDKELINRQVIDLVQALELLSFQDKYLAICDLRVKLDDLAHRMLK